MSATPALGIEHSARVTGGLRFVELSLFRLVGASAGDPGLGDDEVACYLAGAALAHAWRAEQLGALLPVSAGLPGAEACTVCPSPAARAALAAVAAFSTTLPAGPPGGAGELLDALVGPLGDALDDAYAGHQASSGEGADLPLRRVLRRVRADLAAVAAEGRELLAARSAGSPTAGRGLAAEVLAALSADPAPFFAGAAASPAGIGRDEP